VSAELCLLSNIRLLAGGGYSQSAAEMLLLRGISPEGFSCFAVDNYYTHVTL
jgi:hypothetical protein